jgi:hypothetical protein
VLVGIGSLLLLLLLLLLLMAPLPQRASRRNQQLVAQLWRQCPELVMRLPLPPLLPLLPLLLPLRRCPRWRRRVKCAASQRAGGSVEVGEAGLWQLPPQPLLPGQQPSVGRAGARAASGKPGPMGERLGMASASTIDWDVVATCSLSC